MKDRERESKGKEFRTKIARHQPKRIK